MADGEQPKIRLDKFTAKVVPDPKNPGPSLCLQGFLGAAPDPAQTRLYWDASLSSFVDIDNADILHSEPLPKEQSPLGGSYLWVSTSAEVTASSAGGASAKGKFFEGPVTSTYGSAFAGGAAELRKQGMPTIGQWCTFTYCPVVAAPAAEPAAGAGAIGSYAPHCWYSWNACPTMYGCGPHRTPGCPMVEHAAPEPAIAGSYAPHCWYSWNACPTLYGCGPHNTPACPIVERPVGGSGGGVAGSYAPGCWYSFNACPTMYGCGPHRTPACPMVEPAQALTATCPPHAAAGAAPAVAGSYAPHCWYSWNACPTLFGCGPHHTPACPMVERPVGGGGGGGIAGSYAPGCWYSFNACPTMFGCGGPHHTPACPL
jgi:hypothetical protein